MDTVSLTSVRCIPWAGQVVELLLFLRSWLAKHARRKIRSHDGARLAQECLLKRIAETAHAGQNAATPIATDMMTNRNLPREACSSRQAIFAAELHVNEAFWLLLISSLPLHRVFHDGAVAQHDAAVGVDRHLRVMRYQHQRRTALTVAVQQ